MHWIIIILLFLALIAALAYLLSLRKRLATICKDEIEKTENRRSAFISIISHQLRTPLSIIKGYLESLLTGDLGKTSPGQKEYLTEAYDINIDSIKMVNDYLNVVRLDSENMAVDLKPVDFVQLVENTIRRLTPLAKASNCELIFEKPAKMIPPVKLDIIKIKQVIENALTNAIKYIGGKGSATVHVIDKGETIEFSCRDTGVGIPEDQQDEVFTKFFRAKNVINKNTKGSGLGLFLSKIIIDAHKGKIWIESEEGKGTTVRFEIPK
ncbi:HAMP domain-containing histidine kinase [Patescibacteria group bacterium]|nr:HAMP domain-containing histidine kinase [Patescibacteria group bacterium]MBU0964118.1 HAMP domain-containing histidine kinase [Patescibacteria group bacterium]